jgi:hypothetical protein
MLPAIVEPNAQTIVETLLEIVIGWFVLSTILAFGIGGLINSTRRFERSPQAHGHWPAVARVRH